MNEQPSTLQELFRTPERWLPGRVFTARDAEGREVSASHPDAVAWTLLAGVQRVYPPVPGRERGQDYSAGDRVCARMRAVIEARMGYTSLSFLEQDPCVTFADLRAIIEAANV